MVNESVEVALIELTGSGAEATGATVGDKLAYQFLIGDKRSC
jgi:hypothetical protein